MAKHTKTHLNTLEPGWMIRAVKELRERAESPPPPEPGRPPRRKKWVPWGSGRPGQPQDAHGRKGSLKGGSARRADQVLDKMFGELDPDAE